MPIYEYRCANCNRVFEEWLKEFDVETYPCPYCAGEGKRMISQTSFILKGGGWYATEYGNRSKPEPQGKDDAPAAAEPSSGLPQKMERPAAKTEAPAAPTVK